MAQPPQTPQTHQQLLQGAYPPQMGYNPPSAIAGTYPPPPKRQRLSPNPSPHPSPQNQSPYPPPQSPSPYPPSQVASPYPPTPSSGFGLLQIPNSPHAQHNQQPQQLQQPQQPQSKQQYQQPQQSPQNQHYQPPQQPQQPPHNQQFQQPQQPHQPYQTQAMQQPQAEAQASPSLMPPPSKPADRTGDQGDLDAIASSGINLKDEENYMFKDRKFSQQTQANTSSFSANTSGSNSFNEQNRQNAEASSVSLGDGNVTSPEEEKEKALRQATHRLAARASHHLNDPFLTSGALVGKLGSTCKAHGCTFSHKGFYEASNASHNTLVEVMGPDGSSTIADKGQPLLDHKAPLEPLMVLLALGSREFLRGKLSLAFSLSRHRRMYAQGYIPPEWENMAKKEKVQLPADGQAGWENPETYTHSTSKRKAEETKAGQSKDPAMKRLHAVSRHERKIEEERLAKRRKRQGIASKNDGAGTEGGNNAEPGTPGSASSERLLDLSAEKKSSKKELKQAEVKANEAALHHNANQAARLAMNTGIKTSIFGGKKKTYGWMTGGMSSGTSTPGPSRISTSSVAGSTPGTPNTASAAGTSATADVSIPQKQWGDYRDDGPDSHGIQEHDFVKAIQVHSKNTQKTLQRLYTKQAVKDR